MKGAIESNEPEQRLTVTKVIKAIPPVVHGQEGEIGSRRGVGSQMLDGGVGRENPSVPVELEPVRIVDVHLDQVFVEAVEPTTPAAPRVDERPIVDEYLASQQAGPRLELGRVGVEEVALGLGGELAVLRVPGQVAQPLPLEYEGPGDGKTVLPGASDPRLGVEKDVVVGNSAWGVEGNLEVVCQHDGLFEQGIDGLLVLDHVLVRVIQEVVR